MDFSFSLGAELNPPQYAAWTARFCWFHGSRSLCQIPRFRAWTEILDCVLLLLSAFLLLRLAGQWVELLSAALCVTLASLRRL